MLRFEVLSPADALRLRRGLAVCLCLLLPLFYLAAGSAGVLPLPACLAGDGMGALWCALAQLALTLPVCWLGRGLFSAAARELRAKTPGTAALAALGAGLALAGGLFALAMTARGAAGGDAALVRQYRGDGCFASAAGVLTLAAAARLLAARAAARAAAALDRRAQTPATATLAREGKAVKTPAAQMRAGDIFLVRPSEGIPADGVVLEGRSCLNEAALTGVETPVDKAPGDTVRAGTVNGEGALACRATHVGQDTALARLLAPLRPASLDETPGAPADRACTLLVRAAPGLAAVVLILWLLLGQTLPFALQRAAAALLFCCPCALCLAAASALWAGRAAGARRGMRFASAAALEAAGGIGTVLLNQDGAVATGKPCVTEVVGTRSVPPKFLLGLAAGLEARSDGPLAGAVLQKADADGVKYRPAADFQVVPGQGLLGKVAGKVMAGGSEEFIRSQCALPDDLAAAGKRLAAAGRIAALAGLDGREVTAGLTDAGLAEEVRRRQAEGRVAMAGNGVRDAAALDCADLGVVVADGADALPTAGLALLRGDLTDLPAAVRLSRRTAEIRRQSRIGAACCQAVGVLLAAGAPAPLGALPGPVFAAACLCLACLGAAANAARLNGFDPRAAGREENNSDAAREH